MYELDAGTVGDERCSGREAAVERAGDHGDERHVGESLGEIERLLATGVVEPDAGRTAGEHVRRVGRGPGVADQDDGGHGLNRSPRDIVSRPTPGTQ